MQRSLAFVMTCLLMAGCAQSPRAEERIDAMAPELSFTDFQVVHMTWKIPDHEYDLRITLTEEWKDEHPDSFWFYILATGTDATEMENIRAAGGATAGNSSHSTVGATAGDVRVVKQSRELRHIEEAAWDLTSSGGPLGHELRIDAAAALPSTTGAYGHLVLATTFPATSQDLRILTKNVTPDLQVHADPVTETISLQDLESGAALYGSSTALMFDGMRSLEMPQGLVVGFLRAETGPNQLDSPALYDATSSTFQFSSGEEVRVGGTGVAYFGLPTEGTASLHVKTSLQTKHGEAPVLALVHIPLE